MFIENRKLQSIQALRGLGVMLVVIFHSISLFPFVNFRAGAAGVDLFFVISGVVMCLSIQEKTNSFDFMKKRCIRVVPMYWIASAIAVIYFYARYPEIIPSSEHILRSFIFAPPPPGFDMPILYPGWSLNYEVFFYTVLGLMLCIGRLAIPISICLMVVLGTVVYGFKGVEKYYFNQLMLEFASGLIVGQAIKCGYKPKKPEAAIFLVVSLILFLVHNMNNSNGFLAWGVPSVLLVLGALGFEDSALIKLKVTQFLGESSYSIYLFHAIVIWIIDWIWPYQPGPVMVISAVLFSLILGAIVFKFLESPLLKLMTKRKSIRKSSKNVLVN